MRVQHPKISCHTPSAVKVHIIRTGNEKTEMETKGSVNEQEEREMVRGLSFSHMKSPETSRLGAELGSAG